MAVVTLTKADNRCTIEAREGDEIVVRLPETPATGVRWQIEQTEGAIELERDSFELNPNPQFGSGGFREFRFRVQGALPGQIMLKHWQAWEGEASITERYTVEIVDSSHQ